MPISTKEPRKRKQARSDLTIRKLPPLQWDAESLRASLPIVFEAVEQTIIDAYNWYLHEKKSMSRVSKIVRVVAVALLTIGGVLPILALVTHGIVDGEWGFVALAVGAGSLLLDRAFGFSSSWARYATAAMDLKAVLEIEQLRWIRSQVSHQDGLETGDVIREVDSLVELASRVNGIICDETSQWSRDFHENLTELRANLGSHPR